MQHPPYFVLDPPEPRLLCDSRRGPCITIKRVVNIPCATIGPPESCLTTQDLLNMAFPYPLITLEEHFLSPSVVDFYTARSRPDPYQETVLLRRCRDDLVEVGGIRLKSMKDNQVSLQVLSHAASAIALDVQTCKMVNDELAENVRKHPGSFAGFATLPMIDPGAASKELRRCIQDLHFVGALVDNNCDGRFYDDSSFWPVFEAAQELDVPIYIHPSYNDQVKPLLFDGNYPDAIAQTLSMYAWGWHSENALHIIRLFAAGVFDRFPRLKIIIGHMGEMLPFQLDRIIRISANQWPMAGVKLQRQLRQVWDENIWVTTSGMFAVAPMATVLRQCKPDRILYSVDYPFTRNEWGLQFLKDLREDGLVSEEVLEGIAYKNAEKLLGVKVGL
jgi:predicted TIM-barrel fold metal-dependent hydrolase